MSGSRWVNRIVAAEPLGDDARDDVRAALSALAVQATADPGGPIDRNLRTVVANLPVSIFTTDADGVFTSSYGGGLQPLGVGDDELVGLPMSAFGDMAAQQLTEIVATGRADSFEVEGETDGRPWSYSVLAVPLDGGGIAAVSVDTSSRLSAERGIVAQAELHRTVLDALDEGIIVRDAGYSVVSVNQRAIELTGGADESEIIGYSGPSRDWEIIDEHGRPIPLEERPSWVALHTGEAVRDVIVGVAAPGLERRWLRMSGFPVEVERGRLVVTSFSDVTREREMQAALAESEERFRRLAEEAPIGIFISDPDRSVTYANRTMEELIGRSAESMRESGWAVNVHPDDVERLMAVPEQYGDTDSILIDQFRVVHPDGSVRWLRARANRLLDDDGQPIQTIGTAADITDFVLATERVRESEERTRAILETAAEGIVTSDEHGLVIEFNAAAERITGFDSDEVVGSMQVESLLGPDQRELLMGYFTEYLDGSSDRLIGAAPIEIEVLRKDGSTVPVELALTEVVTSEGRLFTAMIHDISERRAFELELEHRATHDDLTGLPNRALLVAELEAGLNRAARRRTTVGVLFVELGRLKLVTDSLGHRAGDSVILEAAQRLTEVVGAEGTVTRFGGDHFVVFVEDLDDAKGAVDLAGRIIGALDRPYQLGAEEAFISAAVGVSLAPNGVGIAESLISNADVAMNRAKLDNGTGIEVFDVEMREWVDSRRKLEVAMRHGIERGEFELYYQPVVAVDSGRVHGFEALIRWNHPEMGLLSPAQFIPLAEDSGLILPLGEWIVEESCRRLAAWQAAHPDDPPQISVNLSGRQLALPHLAESVARALQASGADPSGLHLEITETVLLEDVDRVGRTLDELKAIGVRLAMDDFGTGYSSLTYLARLPIDIVKVDRSFVSQLGTPSRDASIVSLVVGLAQTLHLEVVAEGVETEVQLAALADLDCEFAQGYYFARPCPVHEADVHLASRQLGPG